MDIRDNTVSAVNQMINSSELSFLGNEKAQTRILVVGNSITRHGPNQEIGWIVIGVWRQVRLKRIMCIVCMQR